MFGTAVRGLNISPDPARRWDRRGREGEIRWRRNSQSLVVRTCGALPGCWQCPPQIRQIGHCRDFGIDVGFAGPPWRCSPTVTQHWGSQGVFPLAFCCLACPRLARVSSFESAQKRLRPARIGRYFDFIAAASRNSQNDCNNGCRSSKRQLHTYRPREEWLVGQKLRREAVHRRGVASRNRIAVLTISPIWIFTIASTILTIASTALTIASSRAQGIVFVNRLFQNRLSWID